MNDLELENLTKRYSAGAAVDGIDLFIEHGEFVCLLGPSGCGKTTTLRMIAGFVQPDAGQIRLGGRIVSSATSSLPPERRNMGMIFQGYAVWPHMTVRDNVSYGLKMKSIPMNVRRARTDVMLESAKLLGEAQRYASELSGGQQQRVALARALVTNPDILLLDEPLSNLDANLRGEMRFEIRRLHDQFHYTSIYVTHDQAEAMTMADRIVVMNGGRIEQIGTAEDVYERPVSAFVAHFVGASNVIRATCRSEHVVDVGGYALQIGHGAFTSPGEPMSFCVKPHDIDLLTDDEAAAVNTLPGIVKEQAYLGSHRDYVVDVGQDVLITVPARLAVPVGTKVRLRFAADRCRGLVT